MPVLGIGGRVGAARLARALLADPLSSELEWEHEVVKEDADHKALLLKY